MKRFKLLKKFKDSQNNLRGLSKLIYSVTVKLPQAYWPIFIATDKSTDI